MPQLRHYYFLKFIMLVSTAFKYLQCFVSKFCVSVVKASVFFRNTYIFGHPELSYCFRYPFKEPHVVREVGCFCASLRAVWDEESSGFEEHLEKM